MAEHEPCIGELVITKLELATDIVAMAERIEESAP
jgi:hypothetical protein